MFSYPAFDAANCSAPFGSDWTQLEIKRRDARSRSLLPGSRRIFFNASAYSPGLKVLMNACRSVMRFRGSASLRIASSAFLFCAGELENRCGSRAAVVTFVAVGDNVDAAADALLSCFVEADCVATKARSIATPAMKIAPMIKPCRRVIPVKPQSVSEVALIQPSFLVGVRTFATLGDEMVDPRG